MGTTVKLYYANWCGNCVSFKPTWNVLKKRLSKLGILSREYESEKDRSEVTSANIQYFPTIRISYNNKTVQYDGPRTTEGILNFINTLPIGGVKQRGGNETFYKDKCKKYKAKYKRLKRRLEARR